jgi:choice-of-anchor B domain-containing protein
MVKRSSFLVLLFLFLFFLNCNKTDLAQDTITDISDSIEQVRDSITSTVSNFTPCENGFAGIFPCAGYDLIAHLPLSVFESQSANDNWGWTDPETGIQYVLSGLDDGTAFISLEEPESPLYLGKLPTATTPSIWRDIKVFNNHAYIVSEATDHGLQVFDLTRLRGKTESKVYTADVWMQDFSTAHNIAINEDTGYAYVVGSNLYEGGPVFIDINIPDQPVIVGGYSEESYTHDAQIVVYNGPDQDYRGRELLFGSNSDAEVNNRVVILDVTDKSAPELITSFNYENAAYTHQGYLTEDHRYFFLGDELDELNYGSACSTKIFDLTDLSSPKLHLNYYSSVNSIDHNGYILADQFFMANYSAGLRVFDISKINEKQLEEVGFFDTYPEHNDASFNGAWNIYPFFESGIIAINDIESGLFLVKSTPR